MKSRIVFFILFLAILKLSAQNITNPSFDSVYLGGIDRMHAWITSDAWLSTVNDTVLPMTPNTHFVGVGLQYHELLYTSQLEYSNAYDGAFAMKLLSIQGRVQSNGVPYRGFVVNGDHFYTNNLGYIDYAKCGTPFPYRPAKLRGHYKFDNTSPSLTNFGRALVLLKKYNTTLQKIDTIAYAETTTQLFASGWALFELPLTYYSTAIPDSVVLVIESSALGLSSTFTVDSLGFFYPQPGGVNDLSKWEEQPFIVDQENQQLQFKKDFTFISASVMDINGRQLKSILSTSHSFSLIDLPKGIYLLQIVGEDKRIKSYKFNK